MTKGSFVDLDDDLDPAVTATIGGGERRRADARLSPKARKQKAKAQAKAQARLERRVNWDLPPEIKQRVKDLASEHLVPESQIAALLIADSLRRLDAGELDVYAYKVPSSSPRYEANLVLGEGDSRKSKKPGLRDAP